jgi:TP901 family phage tail tape measure protein
MPLVIEVRVDDGQVQAKMKNVEQSIKRVGESAQKSTGSVTNMMGFLRGFTTTYAAYRGMKMFFQTGIDIETQMLKVRAITRANVSEMNTLESTILKLGRTTVYTASQVAGLALELGKLGFTSREINSASKGILMLAQATQSDLARAAEVAGMTIRSFNMNAGETGRIADIITMGLNSSALTMERFAESMKYVAPIAEQLGVSIEHTTALLSALADRGIHGSLAGVALRHMFLRLAGPMGLASKHIEGFNLQANSLGEIFDKVNEVGLDAMKIQKAFGLRVASSAMILKELGSTGLQPYIEAMEKANGAAQEQSDIMTSGWYGAIKRLQSALQGLAIDIFKAGTEGRTLLDILTSLVLKISDWYNAAQYSKHKGIGSIWDFFFFQGFRPSEEGKNIVKVNKDLEALNERLNEISITAGDWKKMHERLMEYRAAVGEENVPLPSFMKYEDVQIGNISELQKYREYLQDIFSENSEIINLFQELYKRNKKTGEYEFIEWPEGRATFIKEADMSEFARAFEEDYQKMINKINETNLNEIMKKKMDKIDQKFKENWKKTGPPGIAGLEGLPADPKTMMNLILGTEFGKDPEVFMRTMMGGGVFQDALGQVERFDKLGVEGFQDMVKQIDKYMERMKLAADITAEFGQALGASIVQGNLSSFKEFLKQTLLMVLSFLEKLSLEALAAAGFKAILGDWGAIARVLGVMLAFETAKGAVMAFKEGGINSELYNGRIGKGGVIRGPGTGTSDSILARFSNGEAILNAAAVRNLGADRINYMNQFGRLPAFAAGGINSVSNETFTGDITMNFSNTNMDPFYVFRSTKDYVRRRKGRRE